MEPEYVRADHENIIFETEYNGNHYVILSDDLQTTEYEENDDIEEMNIYFAKKVIKDGKECLEAAEEEIIPYLEQQLDEIAKIGEDDE